MNSLLHFTQTATLALWLSITGFATVGILVPTYKKALTPAKKAEPKWDRDEIILGDDPQQESSESAQQDPAVETVATLPAPPELPTLAEFTPLPEIPDLPVPKKTTTDAPVASKPATRPASSPTPVRSTGKSTSAVKTNNSSTASTGASESSRLSAGKMPKPSYPSEAKRKNQTGTVIVEFTIDANGLVISAYAKSSSGWPILDSEAVRTVRRWSFPPGGIMKIQRPIVFRLQ